MEISFYTILYMVPEISTATDFFCHLGPKYQKNEKKTPRDIIILHKFTKNYDNRLYWSWDMTHNRCNHFSFWAIFCPFTLVTAQKMKIFKKWRKHLKISFYTSVPKTMTISYTVPEIWCVTDVIVTFHFGLFFTPLTPPV